MPQKHANLQVDFFELKAIRTQPTQKRYFYSAATGAKGDSPLMCLFGILTTLN